MPDQLQLDWFSERAERCAAQIWEVCQQALALGVDVVLDFGFGTRDQRERQRTLVHAVGARVVLHVVTAESSTRRERVKLRNRERAESFAFEVSDAMFDGSEARWEPPSAAELEQSE